MPTTKKTTAAKAPKKAATKKSASSKGDQLDLTKEDDAALDSAWARLARELGVKPNGDMRHLTKKGGPLYQPPSSLKPPGKKPRAKSK